MTALSGRPLRLGSRKSPMAITQSRLVAGMITERTGRQVEIVGVTTLGDVSRDQLTQIGVGTTPIRLDINTKDDAIKFYAAAGDEDAGS